MPERKERREARRETPALSLLASLNSLLASTQLLSTF
jgi:hypothetical protein